MKKFVSLKLNHSITAHCTDDEKWAFSNYCYLKKSKQSIEIRKLIQQLLEEWTQNIKTKSESGDLMKLVNKNYPAYILSNLLKVNLDETDSNMLRSFCYINSRDESAVIRALVNHLLDEFNNNKKITTN